MHSIIPVVAFEVLPTTNKTREGFEFLENYLPLLMRVIVLYRYVTLKLV